MKAMILAAGRGSRLAPLTDKVPKPMLPVRDRPLIRWQLEWLKKAGITEIVINLHHLGEQIRDDLGDGYDLGVTLQYSPEDELLETAGGVKHALPLLGDDPFVILNGDIWTDFDFRTLPSAPPDDLPAHIVLTPTPSWRAAGDFEFDGSRVAARGGAFVYCGIAVLTPELLKNRPEHAFSLRDVYFDLIRTRQLSGQIFEGQWLDIGTLEQYESIRG